MNTDPSEANWFKSSRSAGGKECVEVAFFESGHVGVRDSKNPTGPALTVAPVEWDSFTAGVISGKFDLPG